MDVITFDLVSESEASVKAHARQWFEKNFRKLSTWHEREADRRFS
jgi:ABC-type proline/glycine betaine transport system substrate-binding protein